MPIRAVLERGPKGKKFVAFAVDWPGWSRGAKTVDGALETFAAYRERYRPIAERAGLARDFDDAGPIEVIEDRVGPGSVDFWGISFSASSLEQEPMDAAELERKLTVLQACWAYFDDVAARVSPEMRKGPRGGGRDRDRIISHTVRVESEDFAKKVGLAIPEYGALKPGALARYRSAYLEAMRAYQRGEIDRPMRSWTLAFLVRHSAFHNMDHAWEMEDKDLTGEASAEVSLAELLTHRPAHEFSLFRVGCAAPVVQADRPQVTDQRDADAPGDSGYGVRANRPAIKQAADGLSDRRKRLVLGELAQAGGH
jgi:hypothetical protein